MAVNEQVEIVTLLREAADGDAQAVNALLGKYRARLCRTVTLRLDPHLQRRVDASDIVQETLVDAAGRLADYEHRKPVPFFLWLRQIALERLIQAQRRHIGAQKRSIRLEQATQPTMSDTSCIMLGRCATTDKTPSQSAARREEANLVRTVLAQMSEADRELLVMKYVERLSNKEIASELDISVPGVKMRHLRALRKLRPALAERGLQYDG